MLKKINSELNVKNDDFKISIGTVDKKNPETLYIEIGSYVTPLNDKNDYVEDFNYIEKEIKKNIKNIISNIKVCKQDFILISDIASERMEYGKKSYFDIQIYLKPFLEILKNNKKNFKEISEIVKQAYLNNILDNIKNLMKNKEYTYSKCKK